jgi:adenylate cyclase
LALTHSTRRRLSICIVVTLVGAVVGALYSLGLGGQPKVGASIGAAIGGGVMVFELFYVERPAGAWLRRLPVLSFIAATTLVWTAIIAISLQGIPALMDVPPMERDARGVVSRAFLQDVGFSLVVTLFINAALRLRSLVGGRVLANFLSGRYRRPFEQERIFLFLDLAGSTTIAERIGHVRYHSFLRAFLEDLEEPVLEHGGEVYQYVGDEVVITWPVADRRANGRCVTCHFAIVDAIARSRRRYEARFGVVPAFRSGIHCGSVVAGEIGEHRKQIVFVGDVVNTASRVEAEARARGCDLVVSGALLAQVELPAGVETRPLGVVRLKGKAGQVELFELVRLGSD